ncbi:hypothetical protein J6590_091766 [Homalodisca vitripennis]|nr:hypothetical protein J6590_091766 [Homalodisca vitripennis]
MTYQSVDSGVKLVDALCYTVQFVYALNPRHFESGKAKVVNGGVSIKTFDGGCGGGKGLRGEEFVILLRYTSPPD